VLFAEERYSTAADAMANKYVHFPNYNLRNRRSEDKWTLEELMSHIKAEHSGEVPYADAGALLLLIGRMVQQVLGSVLQSTRVSGLPQEDEGEAGRTFQLLSLDVQLDRVLRPWLMEFNAEASLKHDGTADARVKGPLLASLFQLVGIARLNTSHEVQDSGTGNWYERLWRCWWWNQLQRCWSWERKSLANRRGCQFTRDEDFEAMMEAERQQQVLRHIPELHFLGVVAASQAHQDRALQWWGKERPGAFQHCGLLSGPPGPST